MRMILFLLSIHLGLLSITVAGRDAPVVATEGGKVFGISEESTNGHLFYSYYGIPYAEPPLGDLRFKDPVQSEGWSGVRNGSLMPQPCLNIPLAVAASLTKVEVEDITGSENCLVLNVFIPKDAAAVDGASSGMKEKNLPVMVYIHGGAFHGGGALEYQPHVLLNKNIVLVVIQYRLGFLGFLSTEDSVMPGNYGLKDQTMALKWVQRNIRNFGGDPSKVTIFGESAGAASVEFQMLSPKAKGLFHSGIMHSGCSITSWAIGFEHKKVAKQVGSIVGCNSDKGSLEFMKCMQKVDARKIYSTLQDFIIWHDLPFTATPRIDGEFLPDHPLQLIKDGRYNKVKLMIGMNADEGGSFTRYLYSNHGKRQLDMIKRDFDTVGPLVSGIASVDKNVSLSLSKMIFNYYLGGINLEASYAEEFCKMMSDVLFNCDMDTVSQLYARESNTPIFLFEFTHKAQLSKGDFVTSEVGRHWVPHGDDLYFLFRGGRLLTPPNQPKERLKDLASPEDLAVREIMLSLWTNFVTYGHPTPDDSLGFKWEPTAKDDLTHLDISLKPSMKGDSRKAERRFLRSLPTQVNKILNPCLLTDQDSLSTERYHDEL